MEADLFCLSFSHLWEICKKKSDQLDHSWRHYITLKKSIILGHFENCLVTLLIFNDLIFSQYVINMVYGMVYFTYILLFKKGYSSFFAEVHSF